MGMLTGKTAVITGSSRGLGLAIAEAYAREGAAVVIASRTAAAVEKAVRSLTDHGLHAAGLACDAADLEQVQALAELAEPAVQFPEVAMFVESIRSSTRGITR